LDGRAVAATSCTAAMASPEEYPGAAEPLTDAALNKLKRVTV